MWSVQGTIFDGAIQIGWLIITILYFYYNIIIIIIYVFRSKSGFKIVVWNGATRKSARPCQQHQHPPETPCRYHLERERKQLTILAPQWRRKRWSTPLQMNRTVWWEYTHILRWAGWIVRKAYLCVRPSLVPNQCQTLFSDGIICDISDVIKCCILNPTYGYLRDKSLFNRV